MAGDLDFSVQLRLLNEQFNNGVNQARDKFTQYAQSVQRNVDQMNTDTERATTMLAGLNNVSADRLTAEIRTTADQLRQMGAGANLTREQIEAAMQASAQQVTRLARQLEVARSETERLNNTPATPAQLAEAAAKVGSLSDSVAEARRRVEQLSQTNGTPAQIEAAKAKVDTLGLSLDEARQKVTQMSQTRGTPEDIDSAKGKVDNLGSSLAEARAKVLALSQTNGTPEQIGQAKVKIDSLSSAVDEARLNVERLSRTNGTPADIIEAKGRIDSVSSSLDAARLNVEQLSRTNGTPSDIAQAKAKVDLLGSSIDDAKLKVTELSRTVGTPADIAEAKNRVNDLGLSVDAAKQKVKELSQTKGTPEDIENAKIKIASLKDELGLAKDSVKLLRDSKASPEDIEEAQNKVKALTAYISGTRDEVKRLRETKGTPEDIAQAKTDFNNLQSSVTEAKNQVKLLSQTRGTPEDIASAKAKVNDLGDSLVSAKNEVKLLSQSNASPEDIAEAKAKVEALKVTLGATRDEVRQLSQTSASPAEIAEARAKVAALSQDLSGARTEARQLNQTSGSPAELIEAKAKVNELKGGLSAARDEVKRLSETNASPTEIAEAKAKVAALKNELGEARTEARTLGQTSASPADIAQAQAAAQRLGSELDEARLAAERLNSTGASPADIAEAAARVNNLEQELNQARSASVSLANELAGAMNRASNTTDNARNALYRMANIRVPETIRGEIDSISRALVDFQNNSGRPAAEIERATRAAEAQIRRLENELNGLDDTQNRVNQGAGGLGNNVNKLQGAFGSLQGLLAAAGLGIGVAEIIATADAFKMLEARIKLATGEGAAFVTGFEGVKQIANETFSSIESTGELFTRISQAGEELGLAQTQVLEITRTINEAIKLSGGSAASADAAITQLIQGLQSGVVRGEEFNSIMEQAPRLAKAMADGLGVTRGELRALSQDGKLTSEVVINAIRSQGETIANEFGTLPLTVGNSLQVVKNQIFNFIGEIDKTIGQSSKLAEAISYIGDSLEDLDPSLVSALTGAFQNTIGAVVELAKGIKGVYDTFGSLISIIAGGSADAAEQVGLITAALHGLNIFIGFIKDGFSAIGVAAGFVVASLYGAMSDLANIASSITFGDISDSFKQTADELQVKSKETWDGAEQDVLDWESSGAQAITNAAKTAKERFSEIAADSEAAYRKMSENAEATAEQQEAALVKYALDNIKANDNVISDKLRVELAEKNLQAVIGDTGEVSIESAKAMQASYTKVGESFAEVALKAQESGKSIELSLSEAIHNANTRGAVDDIVNSLQAMANQGVITGEQLALGQNIAKTQMSIVEAQIAKNMETFGEYAAGVLAKNGNIITAELQHAASLENLAIQMDETGNVMITELDASTVASGRTKEQIDELAGAVGIGLSKEFVKSSAALDELVSGFDDLEKAGYDAGGALVGALTEMSDKARNEVEIEALTARWHELYKEGKITGQELAEGLENIKNRADILKNGINGVTEAYGFLGLKTREELAKDAKAYTDSYKLVMAEGKLTAQQQEEVFTKMAKANTAANGGVIDSFTRAQAAAKGFTVEVDANGRTVVARMGEAANATTQSALATRAHTQSLDNNTASTARNSGAIRANTAERKQQSISVWNAKFATDEATKSESASLAFMQKAEAGIKSKITALNQLSGSTATADESYQKLMRSMGFVDGFKWSSMADYARDMNRVNAAVDRQAESYSANNMKYRRSNKNDDSSIGNNQAKLDKIMASVNAQYAQPQPQPQLPQSALDAIANLSKTPNFDASKGGATKTIDVNFKLGGASATMSMPDNQENALMALLQQLQDSKAIAGY